MASYTEGFIVYTSGHQARGVAMYRIFSAKCNWTHRNVVPRLQFMAEGVFHLKFLKTHGNGKENTSMDILII